LVNDAGGSMLRRCWGRLWSGVLAVLLPALLVFWPAAAWGAAELPAAGANGQALFSQHCAGCHVNGGNIIRRGKTLKLAALERQGLASAAAIATIAAYGVGQMGGYGPSLGESGVEQVAAYVWQQAQAGWPKA
jgi:cytochrome c6